MNTLIFIALCAMILSAMLGLVIIGLAIYGQREKRKLLFWSPEIGMFVAVSDDGTGNRVMTTPE